jgi:NO-binding membrane sensor protein with MHYT domain
MKTLVTLIAVAVAVAFTAPAFAGIKDAKNKAECEAAGGVWIDKDQKCGAKTE